MYEIKSKLTGERSFSYVDHGQGQPLLLVHGFPLSHAMWRNQIEFFSKDYRVLCPDLPGFGVGHSVFDLESNPMTMAGLADWLVEFLDAVQCAEPVHFCGLSMGGYIGWQFWDRHRTRLRSLIACNTRAANDSEIVRRGRLVAAQKVMTDGAGPVADGMIEKLFYGSDESNTLDVDYIASTHAVILATDPKSIAAGQLAMSRRQDARDWLSQIDLPTLFVAGEHDQITPAEEMKANSHLVTGSQYVVIENASHMTPLEQPRLFNRLLADFLRGDDSLSQLGIL